MKRSLTARLHGASSQMLNEPESVIGLSTGRTTGNLHRLVGEIYTKYPFKVDTVTFFGLDEVNECAARICRSMLHDAENGVDGYIGSSRKRIF